MSRTAFAIQVPIIAALLAALAPPVLPAASPTPAENDWSDPFCEATASVEPLDGVTRTASTNPSSDAYLVSADVNGTKSATASVILVSDTAAYRVDIPTATVKHHASSGGAYIEARANFKAPIIVRYAFVDTVQIDTSPAVTCPSEVLAVRPYKPSPGSSPRTLDTDDAIAAPVYVQAVPPAGCARIYEDPKITFSDAQSGNYNGTGQVVEGRIYVNSDGHVVKSEIVKSSGVPGLDAAALGQIQMAHYRAARFLCVPVVGEYRFRTEFR